MILFLFRGFLPYLQKENHHYPFIHILCHPLIKVHDFALFMNIGVNRLFMVFFGCLCLQHVSDTQNGQNTVAGRFLEEEIRVEAALGEIVEGEESVRVRLEESLGSC
jgi:hypothetical protein